MKKVLFLLLLILLLFCGCTKNSDRNTFRLEETNVKVSFAEGETMIRGSLNFFSPEKIALKLSEPKELENCVFKLENGVLSFGLDETQCNLENLENIFGGGKGFQTLFEALSAAGKSDYRIFAGKVKLDCAFGEAVLALNENNEIKALRAGEYDYEFTSSRNET